MALAIVQKHKRYDTTMDQDAALKIRETLSYIRQMSCELRDIAGHEGEDMLVYLLDLVREEADSRLIGEGKQGRQ